MNPQQITSPPVAGPSKLKKLIVIASIVVVVLILISVLAASYAGQKKINLGPTLARNESAIPVLEDYKDKAQSPALKNRVARAMILFSSDSTAIKQLGVVIGPKDSGLAIAGLLTDEELNEALAGNRLDPSLEEYLNQILTKNIAEVEEANTKTDSERVKATLDQVLVNLKSI